MRKAKRGFTLIEIIVTVVILTIVVGMSSSLIVMSLRSQKISYNDYKVQSAIRIASQVTDKMINNASAIFTIPVDMFGENKLTEGWDYYGVSDDGTEIVYYEYNNKTETHDKKVIVEKQTGITYTMNFSSDNDRDEKYVKYSIYAYENGVKDERVSIDTTSKALNSLQVIFRGTALQPANVIAFRSELRPTKNNVALVTFVLDVSGSMAFGLNTQYTVHQYQQRITKLKQAVRKMIQEFSAEENIVLCFVPFSSTANYPDPESYYSNQRHFYYSMNPEQDEVNSALQFIDSLTANTSTNTGDGLRRAYYNSLYFDSVVGEQYGINTTVNQFMILLVDGVTNQSTFYTPRPYTNYFFEDGRVDGIYNKNVSVYNGPNYYEDYFAKKIADESIRTYVIGFSNFQSDLENIDHISEKANASKVYKFTDGLDLTEVFLEIKADIINELWHVRGPQL